MKKRHALVPSREQLIKPTLLALYELGGSGNVREIYEKVIIISKLTDEILEIPHKEEKGRTEVSYRLAWARTYLKNARLLENSARGVWVLSSLKTLSDINAVDEKDVVMQFKDMCKRKKKERKNIKPEDEANFPTDDIDGVDEQEIWRTDMRELLISLNPDAFERLTQRVLRESGFIQVEVTGKSGDGGIDGKGIAKINGFLSFHVMFQCKRYSSSITAPQIRDFRGAMTGRTDKGLFITTSSFTRDAIREATRDGAPPIDLIDGEQLIDILKSLSLGIKTVETIDIDYEWFDKL